MRTFRKANAADAEAITTLYRELTTQSPVDVLPERISDVSNNPNTYLTVCEDNDGEILATALLTLCDDVMFKQQPFALLENVVVNKDYQREGIGKSLMEHIEEFCLQHNCSKIMLLSNSDNRAAHDFYTAMGYDPDAKLGFIKYRRNFGS